MLVYQRVSKEIVGMKKSLSTTTKPPERVSDLHNDPWLQPHFSDDSSSCWFVSLWKYHMVVSIHGEPPNGWFMKEHPIKVDDLGYPYFRKPPYVSPFNGHMFWTPEKWHNRLCDQPGITAQLMVGTQNTQLRTSLGLVSQQLPRCLAPWIMSILTQAYTHSGIYTHK